MSKKTENVYAAIGQIDVEALRNSSIAMRTAFEEMYPDDPVIGEAVAELMKAHVLARAFNCPHSDILELLARLRSERREN